MADKNTTVGMIREIQYLLIEAGRLSRWASEAIPELAKRYTDLEDWRCIPRDVMMAYRHSLRRHVIGAKACHYDALSSRYNQLSLLTDDGHLSICTEWDDVIIGVDGVEWTTLPDSAAKYLREVIPKTLVHSPVTPTEMESRKLAELMVGDDGVCLESECPF
jgi:hypothetical protein